MPLSLKLGKNEKIVVNGVVLEVSSKANVAITVHNHAHILREPQILTESEADTPVRRARLAAQAMILDHNNIETHDVLARQRLADLRTVFKNADVVQLLDDAEAALNDSQPYITLSKLRQIEKYETLLFNYARLEQARLAEISDSKDFSAST